MFVWCALLFAIGVFSFLDAILMNNEVFGRVSSIFFLLISLGLLIRTSTKRKQAKKESYEKRIFSLEKQVNKMEREQERFKDF